MIMRTSRCILGWALLNFVTITSDHLNLTWYLQRTKLSAVWAGHEIKLNRRPKRSVYYMLHKRNGRCHVGNWRNLIMTAINQTTLPLHTHRAEYTSGRCNKNCMSMTMLCIPTVAITHNTITVVNCCWEKISNTRSGRRLWKLSSFSHYVHHRSRDQSNNITKSISQVPCLRLRS